MFKVARAVLNMARKKKLRITKVALPPGKKFKDQQVAFPRMPVLYLELLENPDKIKPECKDKEYRAPEHLTVDRVPGRKMFDFSFQPAPERDSWMPSQASSTREVASRQSYHSRRDSFDDIMRQMSDSDDDDDDRRVLDSDSEDESNDLLSRLQKLTDTHTHAHHSSKRHDSPVNVRMRRELERFKNDPPPTLGQLNNMQFTTEANQDEKHDLIYKFSQLRDSYPSTNVIIPTFGLTDSLESMKRTYNNIVRRLKIEAKAKRHKLLLMKAFTGTEFVVSKYMKFDMTGFTEEQMLSIDAYDRLLIELGEKTYDPGPSKYPVELRLGMLVLGNAAMFIIGKIIEKKMGFNFVKSFNPTINRSQPPPSGMSGPSADILREMGRG